MSNLTRAVLIALAAAVLMPAGTVTYTASYDPVSSLYRYDYVISGMSFAAGEGITFDFASGIYLGLVNESAPAEWDPLVIPVDPDPLLPQPGHFDLMALVDGPPLSGISIEFTYLGPGMPGPQPYSVYYADFSERESGNTVSPIPEPWVGPMVLFGLAAIATRRRRAR